jgi:prepilin-type processing-associated H-X9-DG protein
MSTTVSTAQPAPSATWGNAVFVDGHVAWVHFDETGKHWWEGDGWNMQARSN